MIGRSVPSRVLVSLTLLLFAFAAEAQMRVGRFSGPVTADETESFFQYVSTLTPDTDNQDNHWSYGRSGTAVRAMGMVYELDHDRRLLPVMVRFCDALLSARNDLAAAPLGQRPVWTGHSDPVWPNRRTDPAVTGGEQGDVVGNLAYCASTILATPAVWSAPVPAEEHKAWGSSYLARAKTYLREADRVMDHHILTRLLDLSHGNHQFFAADSPYKGGTPVPWNQQMMFLYAFEHLAQAHRLLKDDPTRAARYHALVQDALQWFFTEGAVTRTDAAGHAVYDWGYALPSRGGEDATHAGMDVAGFISAYATRQYGLTRKQMLPFADTLLDVMTLGPGRFAGRVDGTSGTGHAAETTTLRSGYVLLAAFRPEQYRTILEETGLREDSTTDKLDLFSRYLWVKNERAAKGSGKRRLSPPVSEAHAAGYASPSKISTGMPRPE